MPAGRCHQQARAAACSRPPGRPAGCIPAGPPCPPAPARSSAAACLRRTQWRECVLGVVCVFKAMKTAKGMSQILLAPTACKRRSQVPRVATQPVAHL